MFLLSLYLYLTIISLNIHLKQRSFDYSPHQFKLNQLNNRLHPNLEQLSNTKYFQYYKINLDLPCPLNQNQQKCTHCQIEAADPAEIPANWLLTKQTQLDFQPNPLSSPPHQWVWHQDDENMQSYKFVNLNQNQEKYTGAQGQDVWGMIYRENSFTKDLNISYNQAYNQIISGLHTSISSQLCELFVDYETNQTYPNVKWYFYRVANFPDRIANLFTLYEILLGSMISLDTSQFKLEPEIQNLLDNMKIDQETDVQYHFDNITLDKMIEFQGYIYNISTIMNCLECQLCKVFAKMQFNGIATALKIQFSEGNDIKISRNGYVALVNTFTKISSSIKIIELMHERQFQQQINQVYYEQYIIICVLLAINELRKKLKN